LLIAIEAIEEAKVGVAKQAAVTQIGRTALVLGPTAQHHCHEGSITIIRRVQFGNRKAAIRSRRQPSQLTIIGENRVPTS
jgi:hypothetical protein